LSHELDNLSTLKAIEIPNRYKITLTSEGRQLANQLRDPVLIEDLGQIMHDYGKLREDQLLNAVYRQFPWFTVNSERTLERRVKSGIAKPAIYTIGYQAYHVDGLLKVLLQAGIKKLIDTRFNPVSRRYGFHKSTLSSLCNRVGIEYIHVPDVGVPSSWRQELETEQSYKALFQRYQGEILNERPIVLNKLSADLKQAPSALLCREEDRYHCHRSLLADRLAAMNGLPVKELKESPITNASGTV
jgi:uncharacterized protein (DUF488 family)